MEKEGEREGAPYCRDIPPGLSDGDGRVVLYALLSSLHQCFIIIEYLSLLAATQLQAEQRSEEDEEEAAV